MMTLNDRLKFYRLTEEEYRLMCSLLDREPHAVEWPLFSALWSEHCSYKSSRVHLRKFSFRNEMTPDMDGENAGVVDLGYGEKIAFKMESHNHPSFIEPVQGSATGVGGILRDIFTMGARPIMSANYLCFGELSAPRMPYLMNGVAKGISSYGNCVGVPTVTGQTNIHAKYSKNILVNALSVGYYGPGQKMALSKAAGAGNLVVYVGAKTGRDGVHGASMASASFDEDSESKKPNVQIGDPFYEKLLIEACLEVLEKDLVVAMQDMGAAGLTSSSFEMASKGQVGLTLDLKKVPLRDNSMSAEDILLSESQERMLLICRPENLSDLQRVFKKWDLDAAVLGHVQQERKIRLMWGAELLTEIDPDLIVEKAPQYRRAYELWTHPGRVNQLPRQTFDLQTFVQTQVQRGKLNSQHWIHNQFDQRVGGRTASACDNSVAIVRLDHSGRGLALAVGCRPEVMLMDAQIGALDAVYYPAFQLALKGAKALAVTDCLNFGNPQKAEIMSEFVASVEAIAQASREINAPVISGNVSFYNETQGENIISTPATGVVALRESVEGIISEHFDQAHENIISVQFNWVESWAYVQDAFARKTKNEFVQDNQKDVAAFILKCGGLESFLRERNKKVSALKAIGMGGVGITCLKMCSDKTGFDLSYNLALDSGEAVFKDVFYGFVISTSENADEMIKVLSLFFRDFAVEVRKIGETREKLMKFSETFALDFEKFRHEFRTDLTAPTYAVKAGI